MQKGGANKPLPEVNVEFGRSGDEMTTEVLQTGAVDNKSLPFGSVRRHADASPCHRPRQRGTISPFGEESPHLSDISPVAR